MYICIYIYIYIYMYDTDEGGQGKVERGGGVERERRERREKERIVSVYWDFMEQPPQNKFWRTLMYRTDVCAQDMGVCTGYGRGVCVCRTQGRVQGGCSIFLEGRNVHFVLK
jgi:hypothetical protein